MYAKIKFLGNQQVQRPVAATAAVRAWCVDQLWPTSALLHGAWAHFLHAPTNFVLHFQQKFFSQNFVFFSREMNRIRRAKDPKNFAQLRPFFDCSLPEKFRHPPEEKKQKYNELCAFSSRSNGVTHIFAWLAACCCLLPARKWRKSPIKRKKEKADNSARSAVARKRNEKEGREEEKRVISCQSPRHSGPLIN